MRRLIVNADDFGQSVGINEGVMQCCERGIVTSASLMVRWPNAAAAADYARQRVGLSIGLHVDLGEWMYRDGEWVPLYQVVAVDDADAVADEIARQLETFRRLMRRDPTHIDSHQHVHERAARKAVASLGAQIGAPIRAHNDAVRYSGAFYGQGRKGETLEGALTIEHLIQLVRSLPPGTTELGCHPGLRGDAPGMYVSEREQEVATLCDPRVRAALDDENVALVSY